VSLEDLVRESCSDLADGLELFGIGVEAGEEERSVDFVSFSSTVVGSNDDEIEGVSDAGEVVFFELRRERDGREGRSAAGENWTR